MGTEKLHQFFSQGPGKKLSTDEAAQYVKVSFDALVDLTFHFRIPFHVNAAGDIFYSKIELAKWVFENPTVLLRARNKTRKRGQGVYR